MRRRKSTGCARTSTSSASAAITGNGVDSYYGFTKMMWLRNERPEVFRRTTALLPPNAWVIHALTGEVAVDRSSAGNIGGIYDLASGTWSTEMLDALGLPSTLMPERLVASSDVVARPHRRGCARARGCRQARPWSPAGSTRPSRRSRPA